MKKLYFKLQKLNITVSIKLALVYSGLMLLIIVLLGGLVYTGLRWYLFDSAHRELMESQRRINAYLDSGHQPDGGLLAAVHLDGGLRLFIYDTAGELVFSNETRIPGWVGPAMANHGPRMDYNGKEMIQKAEKHMLLSEKIFNNGRKLTVILLRPLAMELMLLRGLVGALLVAGLLGVMVAVLAGYLLSRRVLAPIRQLSVLAGQIEVDNLQQQLELGGINDELHDLARAFNDMLARLRHGTRQQQRFVADAAHELRTPLTVLSGYADMLARWGKEDDKILDEGLTAIQNEAAQMKQLLEKLLLLAKVDSGKLMPVFENIELGGLIKEVADETCFIDKEHRVETNVAKPVFLQGDRQLLKQMLRIAVDNSCKYSSADSLITIIAGKSEGIIRLAVVDEGCGIPDEDLPHVQERFYRVDKSRTAASGGSGLGLAIARQIAELHGGTLQINNRANQRGCEFIVQFPVEG